MMKYGEYETVVFVAEASTCTMDIARQQFAPKHQQLRADGWQIIHERIYESPNLISVHWTARRPAKKTEEQ